ncbi:gas vesicle protein GvpO [Desulfosporosinus sp. FKB]|uniref:gas vesicle protein GvpO n=1 Tax=Desulfosporosinus sp. FKB TaxID=1969835 RepID=UPI000B4A19B6|nr:gas vesicle protein GvpO [Desulfosporosinus sp. FKB]
MDIHKLVSDVKDFFQDVLEKEAHVIGVKRYEDTWLVQVETIEDSEYQRRRALDDVVGIYEVEVSINLEILGYKRVSLRERDQLTNMNSEDY